MAWRLRGWEADRLGGCEARRLRGWFAFFYAWFLVDDHFWQHCLHQFIAKNKRSFDIFFFGFHLSTFLVTPFSSIIFMLEVN